MGQQTMLSELGNPSTIVRATPEWSWVFFKQDTFTCLDYGQEQLNSVSARDPPTFPGCCRMNDNLYDIFPVII